MSHRIEYIVWQETPHLSYCRYSWNDTCLVDYAIRETHHAQPAPSCPVNNTVALVASGSGTLQRAQRDFGTNTLLSVQTVLDSENGNKSKNSALSAGRSPLS